MFDLFSQIRNDDESGQGMVEYGLIVGLIAIIVIAVFVALGPQINSMFSDAVSDEQINGAQDEVENAIDMNNS